MKIIYKILSITAILLTLSNICQAEIPTQRMRDAKIKAINKIPRSSSLNKRPKHYTKFNNNSDSLESTSPSNKNTTAPAKEVKIFSRQIVKESAENTETKTSQTNKSSKPLNPKLQKSSKEYIDSVDKKLKELDKLEAALN